VYFFSATHPISPFAGGVTGTQQNYWSSSTALTFDNLTLVYNTMTNYRDDQNRPLGIVPDTILVPPQLQILAKRLTGATIADQTVTSLTMVGNQPNPLASMFKVVVAPELSADSTTWYLLDTSKVVKPLIWQQRQDTQFISKMGPGDPGKFYRNDYEFEATRRGAAGYGLWFTAAKAVG
jgi:phage major head subunit gpT-like protein